MSCQSVFGAQARPVKASEKIEAVLLYGQIDWTINDFVKWNTGRANLSVHKSSVFNFKFPEVKNSFNFALCLHPRGDFSCPQLVATSRNYNYEDVFVGLLSGNSERMEIEFELLGTNVRTGRTFELISSSSSLKKLFTNSDLKKYPEKYLFNGNLQIRCNFTIHIPQVVHIKQTIFNSERETVLQSMKKLLSSAKLSDFQIVCDGKIFDCHKSIIANKSDALETMITNRKFNEGQKNQLKIEDFDSETVRMMIHFVYCNELPEGAKCSINLLLIADKYNIKSLVQFCQEELSQNLSLENALQILEISEKIDVDHLRVETLAFVAKNRKTLMLTDKWKQVVSSNHEILEEIIRLSWVPHLSNLNSELISLGKIWNVCISLCLQII